MLRDCNLEYQKTWETKTGPDISGTPKPIIPDKTKIDQSNGKYIVLSTQGKAYADWMAALHRPVLPNTGKLSLSFELTLGEEAVDLGGEFEFDTRLAIGGFNYNFSSQINCTEGWHMQISDVKGLWVDSGMNVGKLAPLIPHNFVYSYVFDITAKKYSFTTISIDGKLFFVPSKLQGLIAGKFDWADSCSLQVQQDIGPVAGGYSQAMRNIHYDWT